jgi:hypothetical protein
VHRVSGLGWAFIGLAVLVGLARLDRYDFLAPDRQWTLYDGLALIATGATFLLVLAPVLLLHRRPRAWSEDRMLAIAAIAVACGPILDVATRSGQSQLFEWMTTADGFDGDPDLIAASRLLLVAPGWLLALVAPVAIVRGLDRFSDHPPARFARSTVAITTGLVVLLFPAAMVVSLLAAAAAGAEISMSWWVFPEQVRSLTVVAAWTWAALAAMAGVRAGRGRWWLFLLVSAVLAELAPDLLLALWSIASTVAHESQWVPDVAGWVFGLVGLAVAGGSFALAGAFASVPRSSTAASFRNSEAPDWQ